MSILPQPRPQETQTGPGSVLAGLRKEGVAPQPQTGAFERQPVQPKPAALPGMPTQPPVARPQNVGQVMQNIPWAAGNFLRSALPSSAARDAAGLARVASRPFQTVDALAQITAGVLQKGVNFLKPGTMKQGVAQLAAEAAGEFYKQRYGGRENIANTIFTDPVGFMEDLSAVLGMSAGIAKVGAKAGGALKIADRLKALQDAAAAIDPSMATIRGIISPLQLAPELAGGRMVRSIDEALPDELMDDTGNIARRVGKAIPEEMADTGVMMRKGTARSGGRIPDDLTLDQLQVLQENRLHDLRAAAENMPGDIEENLARVASRDPYALDLADRISNMKKMESRMENIPTPDGGLKTLPKNVPH